MLTSGQGLCSSGEPSHAGLVIKAIHSFQEPELHKFSKVFFPACPVALRSKQAGRFGSPEQERHSHSETPRRRLICTFPKTITSGALSTWDWPLAMPTEEARHTCCCGWPCKTQEVHPISLT